MIISINGKDVDIDPLEIQLLSEALEEYEGWGLGEYNEGYWAGASTLLYVLHSIVNDIPAKPIKEMNA